MDALLLQSQCTLTEMFRRVFGNSDAVHRLLCEFSKIQDVSVCKRLDSFSSSVVYSSTVHQALRKTSRQLKTFIDDHPQLWRQIEV
jgi:hypothetical protein